MLSRKRDFVLEERMKKVLLALLSLLLPVLAGTAMGNCLTDTTQADFQAGVATSVDLTSSPGNVVLTSTTGSSAVDAQNTSITGNGELFTNTQWNAQTFTAGKSGPLSRVDLNLFCYFCGSLPPSITVSIRATTGGMPTGGDLATASTVITNWSVGAQAWFTANFATPATVSSGTQYALVIRSSASYVNGTLAFSNSAISSASGNDVYGGGKLLFSTNSGSAWSVQTYSNGVTSDAGFKTYVGSGTSGTVYNSAGDLVSSVKDGGTAPTWSTVSWNGSTPTATALKFQAAASSSSSGPFTFVGPDGTSATYYTSGASLDRFNGNRYLKYRAFLSTTNSSATPTLTDATVCYTPPASADLSISNSDGVTSVTAGGAATYTLVAANAGPSSVTAATVTDAFPSSLTCTWTCAASSGSSCPASGSGNISNSVNLLSGGSATFTATCSISAAASGTLTNVATISAPAGVSDPATGNNSASDSDTVTVNSSPAAMSLTDSVDYVRVGDVVNYLIQVTNPGASISPTITDALPAQLSGGQWICSAVAGTGATCGSGNATGSGSGNTLTDTPTLPTGGAVNYTYTVTVLAANSNGQVSNTASMKIVGKAASISASDADTVVIFMSGFEDGTTPLAMNIAGGNVAGSITAQFGVDGGLLSKLDVAPVTVASAQSASRHTLFSLQLMRSGQNVLLRSLTTIDGGPFSDVSPWQVVDLNQLRLGFEWQPATTRGDDGFLRAGSAAQQKLIAANNTQEKLTQLQVSVENGIPWLVLIEP
jgi:uncharacterized repeat protein (TIGR01451 family)